MVQTLFRSFPKNGQFFNKSESGRRCIASSRNYIARQNLVIAREKTGISSVYIEEKTRGVRIFFEKKRQTEPRKTGKIPDLGYQRAIFTPSASLIHLINERFQAVEDIGYQEYSTEEIDYKELFLYITKTLDTLFSDLARRSSQLAPVPLTNEKSQLRSELIDEIVVRLGLRIYDLKPIMDNLFSELMLFAQNAHDLGWGKIYLEEGIVWAKSYR